MNILTKAQLRAIEDELKTVQRFAICLNSDSASIPTNAEMEAGILESCFQINEILSTIEAVEA